MCDNIYYSPEKFGLRQFGFLQYRPAYDYNMFVVWEDENGNLFYGIDSGCSCPVPFESFDKAKLTPIDADSYRSFAKNLDSWSSSEMLDASDNPNAADVEELKRRVFVAVDWWGDDV